MRSLVGVIAAILALVAVYPACGGKVVFETEAPDLPSDCAAFCEATTAAGCGTPTCQADCETLIDQVTGLCEEELSGFLRCVSQEDACNPTTACVGEVEKLALCFAKSSAANASAAAGGG